MTTGTFESFLFGLLQAAFQALLTMIGPIINAGLLSILV